MYWVGNVSFEGCRLLSPHVQFTVVYYYRQAIGKGHFDYYFIYLFIYHLLCWSTLKAYAETIYLFAFE